MENLYNLERLALDRHMQMAWQSLRGSRFQQAADARLGLRAVDAARSSARSQVGLLLVRVGLRLTGAPLPRQRAATSQCVCVPVNG